MLFWFSRIFLKYLNEKQLYTTYILGGLSGAFLLVAAYNLLPGLTKHLPALGASASVTAIVIAISFYSPNYSVYLPIIGPVKLKYVGLVFVILDLLFIANPRTPDGINSNAGGHIAHLGGALYGYLFSAQLKKGKDIGRGFSAFLDGLTILFKRKSRMRVAYKNQARQMNDLDYNKSKAESQKEVDRILDKIAKAGYDSLTKKEKEILFKMSNKG